jgi:hypothetical protein
MRKTITATVRAGLPVLFFDNVRGVLNSEPLEAFTSAAEWTDRLLGGNEIVRGENHVTVFVTGNGMTISPDWRRRTLFVELHLSEERAEDRIYKRLLSVPVLRAMRETILAALWSLVRAWDARGRPQPSRSHSAFPAWAATIGGIVEAAGFGCPLETANVSIVSDEDAMGMRLLVKQMTPRTEYNSSEIVDLCRKHDIFPALVGSADVDMQRAQRSAFGKLLARYDNRQVSDLKFFVTGTGHSKRFCVLRPENIERQITRSPLPETDADSESSPQTTPQDESIPRKSSYAEGDL